MAREMTITIPVGAKWVNAPSMVDGRQLTEFQARELVKSGQLRPHGVFDSRQDAERAAGPRSARFDGPAPDETNPLSDSMGLSREPRSQTEAGADAVSRPASFDPPTDVMTAQMRRMTGQGEAGLAAQPHTPPDTPALQEIEGADGFDVNAARRAGYTFTDIADFLAQGADFDVQGAREAGYEDSEIVSYLTRGKGFSPSGTPAMATMRGVYGGLADIAGAVVGGPIDASNWALRQMGVPNLRGEPLQPVNAMEAPRQALAQTELPGGTPLTYESLEDLPPQERPFAVGGEVLGASLPIGAAPLAAARAGAQGPAMLRPIMDAARTSPGRFAAVESGASAGAAQAGGMAEAVRPGEPLTRFGAEVVGAFANPLGLATRGVGRAVDAGRQAAQSLTRAGRESRAAEILQGAMREAGEDTAGIARALGEPDVTPGIAGLTAGQKTGSPTLLAVEAKLAGRSPHFAGEARKRVDEGFASLRNAIDDLTRSGDPESLRQAAQLRERYFNELLDHRLTTAIREAEQAASGIPQRGRAQAQDPSVAAHDALERALGDSRRVETQLWEAIDKRARVQPEGLRAAHGDVRQRLLKEETLDGVTERFLKRIAPMKPKRGQKVEAPSSGELLRFRKHLLAQARKAKAEGNNDFKVMYDRLARAVPNDLDQVPGTATNAARQYTRALHDAFSRTFAGDALAVRRTGADAIPPETLLERAFGAGGNVADVRFRQMVDAAGFGPDDLSPRMASAQERFIRVMAAQTRDQAGRIDPNRLQGFLADNANLLERFPGLRGELTDAASAERLFREVETATTQASRAIRNKAAFSRLTQSEDPARVVGEALASRQRPGQEYEGLVKVARRGGDRAVAGLKSSTLEHATRQATSPDGQFSFSRFRQAMEGDRRQRGLLDLMERNGVMSEFETTRMRKLMQEAEKIEAALGSQQRIDELLDAPDALLDLVLRISGARMGTMATQSGAVGHGLIAAHAGSKFMRRLFDKVPRTRIMDVLDEASRDRKLMTALLTKPTTERQAKALERQINAALIQAGITADLDEEE